MNIYYSSKLKFKHVNGPRKKTGDGRKEAKGGRKRLAFISYLLEKEINL